MMLTRFEVARIVGIRAMRLSEGAEPFVDVCDDTLRHDYTYVASLELYEERLDVCVRRDDRVVHVSEFRLPIDVEVYLNTRDGRMRVSSFSRSAQTTL